MTLIMIMHGKKILIYINAFKVFKTKLLNGKKLNTIQQKGLNQMGFFFAQASKGKNHHLGFVKCADVINLHF
jgi:hypothetical protein